MNVHLIDGTFELFRAYYGAPSATSPDGKEVGATRGLMRSLAALLSRPDVTHVAIAFDTVIESFRNNLFAGYKTGDGIEESLFAQFPLAEQAARALGIVVWSMVEFEADDALATFAARHAQGQEGVEQVVLCSPDKDLSQCVVGAQVVTWDRIRDLVRDEAAVIEKFGIAPASIADYLALVGDSADGIPGIPRWGAKSAATVLAHYKHLEAIPKDAKDWGVKVRGAEALTANLREQLEQARLYKTLATLRTDVPLAESLAQLRYQGPSPGLEEFCREIGESASRYARLEAL